MAHSTFHFSLGLAAGICCSIPFVLRKWKPGMPLAPAFGRWLLASYGMALWAVVPNILRRFCLPAGICEGWWMNLFFFHPLIDRLTQGGMLLGEVGLILCFSIQYLVLLIALGRVMVLYPKEEQGKPAGSGT